MRWNLKEVLVNKKTTKDIGKINYITFALERNLPSNCYQIMPFSVRMQTKMQAAWNYILD